MTKFERFLKMKAEGAGVKEIARVLHASKKQVREWYFGNEMKPEHTKKEIRRENQVMLLELFLLNKLAALQPYTTKDICAHLGVSHKTAKELLEEVRNDESYQLLRAAKVRGME